MSVASFSTRVRKSVKKTITLTVMACGMPGTGRTTFLNMLCGSKVLDHRKFDEPENAHNQRQLQIKPVTVELEEENAKIAFTIVDTPGFGDMIDNSNSFSKILSYIEKQYDDILAEESRIKRNPRFKDHRIHCVLYFIEPTGHGLREIDINLMSKLAIRANVLPILAKADTLTADELILNKKLIMEDIEHYDIPIYNFPYDQEVDDDETITENEELKSLIPFAAVGSEEEFEIHGKKTKARKYPWGVVDIIEPDHSDYLAIRSALLYTHLDDLKAITHDFLYENYRTEKLSKVVEGLENTNFAADVGSRAKEELIRREEERLREFELKVQQEISEKKQQLLAKEVELQNMEKYDSDDHSASIMN